jgi:Thiol-disulfide isomerase and thioredoxins
MKRSFQLLAAAVFVVAAFFFSTAAQAQDAPPPGGFKNAYLSVNKSGKVVLTYTLWKDQVGKGKNTLVFFWASWSEESREEASRVQALYQKYAGKVDVLGVTYNDEISDSMDAMAEWGIKFPQIVDVEDDIAGQFGFDSVPYIVLLGPSGETVATGLRGEAIREAVEKYVK